MASAERQRGGNSLAPPFAVSFLLLLTALTLTGSLPAAIPAAYLAASGATFALYAWDKRAARAERRRIRESTLHLLGLFGGWPGAAFAQTVLRHKSQKRPFLWLFRATVLINCLALALWAASRY